MTAEELNELDRFCAEWSGLHAGSNPTSDCSAAMAVLEKVLETNHVKMLRVDAPSEDPAKPNAPAFCAQTLLKPFVDGEGPTLAIAICVMARRMVQAATPPQTP